MSNADRLLKPGMFATAEIQAGSAEDATSEPAAAVLADANTNSRRVFVVENGAARLRVVQMAEEQQGQARIVSGLKAPSGTVAGIDEMRSVSIEGVSQVFITFDLAKDADVAAQEVRTRWTQFCATCPRRPSDRLSRSSIRTRRPSCYAVSAPRDTIALTTLVEDEIQERLESLNGVGEVIMFGGRRREIHVEADLERCRATT